MIALEQLTKKFGEFVAVDELSLTVPRGEVFGFLGPNGAGKTTTLRMLMGILLPTAGRCTIDGLDCHSQRVEVMRRVGYQPDVPQFYDYLRGTEVLEFVGEMHGMTRAAAKERARELIDAMGLSDAGEDFAANYSLGMKKKLGLASALVHRPSVLLLDEPTTGLDPRAAHAVRATLAECAAAGTTVFLSTHLLDMAEKMCHRVGIVMHGKLRRVGSPGELRDELAAGGSLEDVYLEVTKTSEEPAQ